MTQRQGRKEMPQVDNSNGCTELEHKQDLTSLSNETSNQNSFNQIGPFCLSPLFNKFKGTFHIKRVLGTFHIKRVLEDFSGEMFFDLDQAFHFRRHHESRKFGSGTIAPNSLEPGQAQKPNLTTSKILSRTKS